MKTTAVCFLLFVFPCSLYGQKKPEKEAVEYGVTISFPYFNNFRYHHYEKDKDSTSYGFAGFGIPVFRRTDRQKISAGFSLSTDFPYPIGSVDIEGGTWIRNTCLSFEIRYHRQVVTDRVRFVSGVNFSKYKYGFPNLIVDIKTTKLTTQ